MTDEEMADKYAEEYVMRKDVITENDRVPFDNGYGFQTVDFEKEVKKGYKDGFLAGLKAGRPQWHDLRKDPNDLPKEEEGLVLVVSKNGEPDLSCISTDKRWFCTDYYTGEYKVIAWCEIPTFGKE